MSEVWALGTRARKPAPRTSGGRAREGVAKNTGRRAHRKAPVATTTAPSVPLSLALAPRAVDRGRADVVEILSPRSGFFSETHLQRSRLT